MNLLGPALVRDLVALIQQAEADPAIVGEGANAQTLHEVGIQPDLHLVCHGARCLGPEGWGCARAPRRRGRPRPDWREFEAPWDPCCNENSRQYGPASHVSQQMDLSPTGC